MASPVVLPYRFDLPQQPLPFSAPGLPCALSSCLVAFQRFVIHLPCLRAWPVCLQCVFTVPPVALASACGIVLGVGAQDRVIQCLTLLSPGLQVSVLSLEEGHFCLSALKGYHSVFLSLFTFKLPELRVTFVFWDLIRSFGVTRLHSLVLPLRISLRF